MKDNTVTIKISGPQGSGKSRLAEALGRLLSGEGDIEVDGETCNVVLGDAEGRRRDVEAAGKFLRRNRRVVIITTNEGK